MFGIFLAGENGPKAPNYWKVGKKGACSLDLTSQVFIRVLHEASNECFPQGLVLNTLWRGPNSSKE